MSNATESTSEKQESPILRIYNDDMFIGAFCVFIIGLLMFIFAGATNDTVKWVGVGLMVSVVVYAIVGSLII